MDLQIKGRVALVMGAGGGLGNAIARTLAAEGVRVAGCDRDITALQADAASAGPAGGILPVQFDLGDPLTIDRAVVEIESKLGPIDILVNNSGGPPPGSAIGVAQAIWAQQFQLMVASIIGVTDRLIGGMRERGWGRVITSTSSGVQAPIPNLAISNSLRMSLVGWSKTLAREVAPQGVTVNVVVPGRIDTARVRSLDANRAQREARTVEEVSRESQASIPIGRYGRPEEYAAAITFLASAQASYITGASLRVDGGLISSI